MAADVTVRVSGPLFDGRAPAVVAAFLHDAKEEVANQGYADIHHELDRVLRNPTPYYETQIQIERAVADRVHDGGVIYGPWLEGVGSRNGTTRFKGYFHWRRVRQALRFKAGGIAERILRQRYLGRLS